MRITQGMIEVEHPLTFDIYTEEGTLLLRKGVVIYNQSQIDNIYERRCYNTPDGEVELVEEAPSEPTATEYVEDLIYRLDIAYNNFVTNGYNLVNDIMRIAVEVVKQLEDDPDTMIGIVHIRSDLKHSVIRTLQNTVFSVLTAQNMKWEKKRIIKLACASLTANLGMYPLQDDLAKHEGPLEEWQKKMVRKHPSQAVKMLIAMGVKDKAWLQAVGYHHERLNGSGYPNGLAGDTILEEARLLAIADRYGSAISPRVGRKPRNPQDIMRVFLDQEKDQYDSILARHFIAEVGVYPPGVTVMLKSGEVAVVARRRSKRTCPLVYAVWDPSNEPYKMPKERDTVFPNYMIVEHFSHDDTHRLNADLFWGDEEKPNRKGMALFRTIEENLGVDAQDADESSEVTLF
ncbi:MAG: hypothetical protein HN870_07980 [Gammaproteobacteria bacterium]|jgi:HD-GYP domain-containing protein (c-di-GMP phosphodiesterase class II)|nr:hypothetical protein [Thiotrichales bacterium]MBT4810544.1 hypothetical protein [Thiotrichales bacterium]MBT5746991.1 hypothetical protein [Gammaproteobacteria bacterium]MBT7230575.1 hypothetical protein [Gammaproteobacteria bacterium]